VPICDLSGFDDGSGTKTDGRPRIIYIAERIALLDESAIESAKKAIFEPAKKNGRSIAVWVDLPMRFTLK